MTDMLQEAGRGDSVGSDPGMRAALLAEAQSPLTVRLLRLYVDTSQGLLVAGDRMGNVYAFHLPPGALQEGQSGDPILSWLAFGTRA